MSLILDEYKDNVDKCWYDSSNVLFSKCYDNPNQLKDLTIVFKEGRTYQYNGVDVMDYIMFKTDRSQGKALNKYIVKKYKGVRLSDVDLNELEEEKNNIIVERLKEKEGENVLLDDSTLDKEPATPYTVVNDPSTNEIELLLNNTLVYKGINGKINLFDVLNGLGIKAKIVEKTKGEEVQ